MPINSCPTQVRPKATQSKNSAIQKTKNKNFGAGPSASEMNAVLALNSQGQTSEVETLARALSVRFPLHGFGWWVLGTVLNLQGHVDEALQCLQKATKFSPRDPVGHNDLGVMLKNQGRFSEAETSLRRALTLNPYYAEAHGNLGNTLADQGQLTQAEASLRRALALKPDLAELHYNLGITLRDLGRFAEAESSLRQALVHKPDYAEAHSYLGGTLKDLGRLTESETSLRQSLALNPNYFAAHVNLALTLHDLGRLAESEASLRCALALKPHLAMSHRNLGNILISQDQLGKAMESFRCALAIKADDVISHSNLLFCMSHDIFVDPQQLYAEHLAFGEQFEAPLRAGWPLYDNAKDPARCLQVGFVTGDLRGHPLTNFLEPVFKLLAKKTTLTLHAYATQTLDDAVTDRMRNYFAHWHAVASLNDVDLTNKIHADGIDILIDLSGHTAHNRLLTFARKPAPIQASWLGYLGTTGLQAMDYYLCDPFWIPPGELDWQFTEKPAYLPAAVVFQPSELAPPIKTLPALANGYVTFGSFNRPNKLNASVIALWSMLLRNIPSAKLVLGAIPLASQNGLIQSFAHEGIEPNRLVFYPRSNLQDYLALHHQVDFCLDTYPYGGGATTAHAAWMGVPTLSLAGESPASRFGATEMHHLGLDGFIATSIEDFVAKGCYWAAHITELAELRTTMRVRFEASPLGQLQLFADNFEVLLRTMWERWCNDLPSAQIEVETRLENTEKIELSNQIEPSPQEMETLTSLYNNQRHDEAESLSRVLISRFPSHGFAWKVLGAVLHAVGQLDESLEAKIRSVDLLPNDHEAHFNLAYEFHEQGRLNEAVKSYSLALAIEPNYAVAYCNLGNIFISMGLLPCAEAHCRQAIALTPGMANAHNNLGNALHAQGKYAQAEESYRFALELKPEWAEAYNNLAITLKDQGYRSDQIEFYRKALALAPDWPTAHSNLLFYMSHDISVDPQQLHAEHLAFGKQFETPLRAGWQPHNNAKDPSRCLQVGFVTGDLRDHALANFLEPVFKLLAKKTTLTLRAYATHTLDDAVTDRMRNYFAHWHAVASLNDVDLTNKIHADGIDILIDLSGHTAHNRLLTFARKPAPIQASWLGYLGTTGLQAMDYYLCDPFWIPPGELDWQFTEKPAYLPAAVVFQPSEFAPSVNPLPALANGFITFGSFNRHNKLNASVIVLWSMLLRDIPNARLVLGGIPPESTDILLQNFAHQGIEQGRIVFYPRTNLQDYLALHHQVDLCLDTYPYGGGATTAHAVWMGVPTLSLAGESPASRFGATMMHHLGLDGFIATSIEDFIAKGCYWAEHVAELAELRTTMRARFEASPLGQPQLFADNFEILLRTMWQQWCSDLPSLTVVTPNLGCNVLEASESSADDKTAQSLNMKIEIVSATKLSETDFWNNSALGISLKRHLKHDDRLSVNIFFNNTLGLPIIFNAGIDQAANEAILIFIHDDVWIDEESFTDTVIAGLKNFDVIGVAGNRRRAPNQPAWAFIDQQLTWDDKSHLSGRVAHGKNAYGPVSYFGEAPAECELLDGVFLAMKKIDLTNHNIRFDTQFDFHFYDMDFCRTARQAGLRLATWQLNLTHQSGGNFGSPHWRKNYKLYLEKWEINSMNKMTDTSDNKSISINIELIEAINDVHLIALKQFNSSQFEKAEVLYLEIIKVQPNNAVANHHLGQIEIESQRVLAALSRFEIAVNEEPENEGFWISYIDALMQSKPANIVADALELGQKYGLRSKTALKLSRGYQAVTETPSNNENKIKIHMGCGKNYINGWINIDLDSPSADIHTDLRKSLPYISESVDYIFNEHFLEHITREEGLTFLKECRRILKLGGIFRISTPDLRWLVAQYQNGTLDEWSNVNWHPATPCSLLNEGMRNWEHQFVYDLPELLTILREAGFTNINEARYGESNHSELIGLECRPWHQELIIEAS